MPPLLSFEAGSSTTGGGYDVGNRNKFELKSFFSDNSEMCSLYSSAVIKSVKDWKTVSSAVANKCNVNGCQAFCVKDRKGNPICSELIKANCEGSHVAFFLKKGETMMEADMKKLIPTDFFQKYDFLEAGLKCAVCGQVLKLEC